MSIFSNAREFIQMWRQFSAAMKANPAAPFGVPMGMVGQPLPYGTDPAAIEQATRIDAWAYVGITTIAKNLSAAPLIVEELVTVDSEEAWVKASDGVLTDWTRYPNPKEPPDILLWRLTMSLFTGNAYMVRDDENPDYWYHVSPRFIRAVPNEAGELMHWEVKSGTRILHMDPVDVIQIPMPGMWSDFYGQSPIEPVKNHLLINFYYLPWIKNFFKRGAIPAGVLTTEQNLNEDNKAVLKKEWNATHGGSTKTHGTAVLGNGLKYENVSPPLSELVAEALWKMPREAILAVCGVPPATAGIMEFANYANAEAQIKMLWENGIKPIQRVIAGQLTLQMARPESEKSRFRFDTSKIKALQADEGEQAKRVVTLVRGGVWTANEAREETGKEPIDGGDELLKPTLGLPVGNQEKDDDEGKSLALVPPPVSKATDKPVDPRRKQWDDHYKTVTKIERSFDALIRSYFDGQLDRVLSALDGISVGRSLSPLALFKFLKGAEDDAEALLNIKAENAILVKITHPFITKTTAASGQAAVERVSVSLNFDVRNPHVQGRIDALTNRITDINDYTFNRIKDVLQDVYDDGLSTAEASKRIRETYKEFSKMRADRIAKTEVNGMINGGSFEGYRQADIDKVEWLSAFLTTSRQTHMNADGQTIGINEKFVVGGELLQFPSDPNGSAGNTINCYCDVAPVVE